MLTRVCFMLIAAITMACSSSEAKKSSSTSGTGCASKLKGDWKFGQAPYGCEVSASISEPLEAQYSELTYRDSQKGKTEDQRFVITMHDFIVEYSKDYFKRRSPNATTAQINSWVRLVLATAHQESYWTQYRYGKDNVFRMFKGDGNHGHGMMQIDDRSHKTFIRSNKVYDINPHMVYALDMLYDMRAKAIKKPCSGKSDLDSINRSAYSAYNGGPGSKCRWLKNTKWSRNDKGFYEKYTGKTWEKTLVAAN